MDASRSRCGRWPNPVRDSNGQHDNAVRLSFRLTRGAARMGRYAPLGHDPATVRWRKWIMPRGLVRAVGIEPTLLAERDFELLLSQVNIYLTNCNIYVFINSNALVC